MGAKSIQPLPPIRIRVGENGKAGLIICWEQSDIMKLIRAGVRTCALVLNSEEQVERLFNGESLESVRSVPELPSNPLILLGI